MRPGLALEKESLKFGLDWSWEGEKLVLDWFGGEEIFISVKSSSLLTPALQNNSGLEMVEHQFEQDQFLQMMLGKAGQAMQILEILMQRGLTK